MSPPCVAAVAEYALSFFLSSKTKHKNGSIRDPVIDLMLKASPDEQKVLSIIERKLKLENNRN